MPDKPLHWWGLLAIAVVVALLGLVRVCHDPSESGRPLNLRASGAPEAAGEKRSPKGNDPGPADSNERSGSSAEPRHPAFGERIAERKQMVLSQIQARDVADPCVLEALRTVPRHTFVPKASQDLAYADSPQPIGHGQTISQPYIVAFMTEALGLDPNSRVLEIGTGSGFQAAVCAEVAREVYTIEIVPELAESAAKRLKDLGYTNVHVKAGDGYFGWPDKAPFDAIIGTAAAEKIPQPLVDQLKTGGRMILPHENADGLQYLILVTKDQQGRISQKQILPVRFVPMTGEVQKEETK